MKILITGSEGYIGYPLVTELKEIYGSSVIGIDNYSRSKWVKKVKPDADEPLTLLDTIKGDVADRDIVNEL